MADNPKLEITISGDTAGTGTGPPQPIGRPAEPTQAPQPSEPRAFQQPPSRGDLNAENIAKLVAERESILGKMQEKESKRGNRSASEQAATFDPTRSESIAELQKQLETVDDVLRLLGATAEQVAPKIKEAAESTYKLAAKPKSGRRSVAPDDQPSYRLGPVPARPNPEAEEAERQQRVEDIYTAAMHARRKRAEEEAAEA